MTITSYQIRQCIRSECKLRYPWVIGTAYTERCPRCGGSTRLILARNMEDLTPNSAKPILNNSMEVLLDNIRSAWNVGSIFRTAEGVGIRRIHLCGITPTPDNPKVTKTALGTEETVSWNYSTNSIDTVLRLKKQGLRLWALEWDVRSESLIEVTKGLPGPPVVLVVGNEVCGVDPGVLEVCERIIYVPMLGIKRSFNVAVVFGIAAYYFTCIQ